MIGRDEAGDDRKGCRASGVAKLSDTVPGYCRKFSITHTSADGHRSRPSQKPCAYRPG